MKKLPLEVVETAQSLGISMTALKNERVVALIQEHLEQERQLSEANPHSPIPELPKQPGAVNMGRYSEFRKAEKGKK